MALDKQRILNELNSVVTQLQSADCGCTGNLFSTPGYNNCTINNPMPICSGCGHSDSHAYRKTYSAPQTREPHAMNMNPTNRSCMGRCNPPQMYADTYNYLNGNLMQPVVQEVYNDLKSINPTNTMTNNPMASNMGLAQSPRNENNFVQSITGNSNYNERFMGDTLNHNTNSNPYTNQKMESMAGMGPQIVNMMMSDGSSKPNNMGGQNGQLTGPMIIDAPQSPHGKIGVTPVHLNNANQQHFSRHLDMNIDQGNTNVQPNEHGNHSVVNSLPCMYPAGRDTVPSNVTGTQQMTSVNANPAAQQMTAAHRHPHGQHTQGVTKFNEMFPGVMQGLGGDLGFDPMAIAIQMNPANQQKVAIDTMQKIMNGKPLNRPVESDTVQPVIAGANTTISNIAQSKPDQVIPNSTMLGQSALHGQPLPSEQQVINTGPNHVLYNAQHPQQVYTAINDHNNKNPQQLLTQPMQYPQTLRQMVDPNIGSVISPPNLPTVYEGTSGPNNLTSAPVPAQLADKRQIREPIFPVDISKKPPTSYAKQEKYYEYNTLGQPVEMLSAKIYHTPEPKLPQTLAPQPVSVKNDHLKYSTVKPTVSKTSLIQNTPVCRTSSRSQLQHIYNQYKGSQSYTQQNIKGSGYGTTQSEGNLKGTPGNPVNRAPVERVGDTIAQNPAVEYKIPNKVGEIMGHNGDVPVNRPIEDASQKILSMKQSNCRNGLQDITYTSYPTSTAWSFHGEGHHLGYHKKFRV